VDYIVCTPKSLPNQLWVVAAQKAIKVNSSNYPGSLRMASMMGGPSHLPDPDRLAVMVGKHWPSAGVRLTVGFMDNPPADLRVRIISHMNAWGKTANVQFTESTMDPEVRIARAESAGYWSYVGTDILSISRHEPTMNLEAFTMKTPDSEFYRVVRHETGHTLGFPHEHMRRELVERIDVAKAMMYFGETQGWTEEQIRRQVLTPFEEATLLGTAHADAMSIMCYQMPGTITKDGEPIVGGQDIDEQDFAFAASVYPKQVATLTGCA